MSPSLLTGAILVALLLAFNVLLLLLAKAFADPDVLGHEPAAILERFRGGDLRRIVPWWLFTQRWRRPGRAS